LFCSVFVKAAHQEYACLAVTFHANLLLHDATTCGVLRFIVRVNINNFFWFQPNDDELGGDFVLVFNFNFKNADFPQKPVCGFSSLFVALNLYRVSLPIESTVANSPLPKRSRKQKVHKICAIVLVATWFNS
jgi:hypothetical protein